MAEKEQAKLLEYFLLVPFRKEIRKENEVTGFLAKEIIARHPPQSGSRIDFEYLS